MNYTVKLREQYAKNDNEETQAKEQMKGLKKAYKERKRNYKTFKHNKHTVGRFLFHKKHLLFNHFKSSYNEIKNKYGHDALTVGKAVGKDSQTMLVNGVAKKYHVSKFGTMINDALSSVEGLSAKHLKSFKNNMKSHRLNRLLYVQKQWADDLTINRTNIKYHPKLKDRITMHVDKVFHPKKYQHKKNLLNNRKNDEIIKSDDRAYVKQLHKYLTNALEKSRKDPAYVSNSDAVNKAMEDVKDIASKHSWHSKLNMAHIYAYKWNRPNPAWDNRDMFHEASNEIQHNKMIKQQQLKIRKIKFHISNDDKNINQLIKENKSDWNQANLLTKISNDYYRNNSTDRELTNSIIENNQLNLDKGYILKSDAFQRDEDRILGRTQPTKSKKDSDIKLDPVEKEEYIIANEDYPTDLRERLLPPVYERYNSYISNFSKKDRVIADDYKQRLDKEEVGREAKEQRKLQKHTLSKAQKQNLVNARKKDYKRNSLKFNVTLPSDFSTGVKNSLNNMHPKKAYPTSQPEVSTMQDLESSGEKQVEKNLMNDNQKSIQSRSNVAKTQPRSSKAHDGISKKQLLTVKAKRNSIHR